MKKVLVITYYWPPSGGAGVQRWLKFAKYLRGYGWEPVIYTPENPESPADDNSLLKDVPGGLEVIRTRIWEPYSAYKKFVGRKSTDRIKTGFLSESKKPSWTEKIAVWIRGNLFIPDARKYWIKPSIRFLGSYLREHPVDAMVSTGPPHSMHLIALGIKEKTGLPWLADFRDPWTNIDFYDKLMLSSRADKRHKKLEQQVIQKSDRFVTVSGNWADDFRALGVKRVDVVTNGFDPDDFSNLADYLPTKFEIVHFGSMNADRNPEALWKALRQLADSDAAFGKKLQIKLIGFTDYEVMQSLSNSGLTENTQVVGYLPHREVLQVARQAALLLLPLNDTPNVNGIVPGKLFEYLGLERPVLCIGDIYGDSAKIIEKTGAGEIFGFADQPGILNGIRNHWKHFNQPETGFHPDREAIKEYSRKYLAGRIGKLLDEITP